MSAERGTATIGRHDAKEIVGIEVDDFVCSTSSPSLRSAPVSPMGSAPATKSISES